MNLFKIIFKFKSELVLFFIYCLMFLPLLGKDYIQPTDPVWTQRGIHFYEMFRNGMYSETYTKYHPGVTIMWLTGIAYKTFYHFQKIYFGSVRDLWEFQFDLYITYSLFAKILIVSTIGVLLTYCYWILNKIFNNFISFFTILFIITDPFSIANIRSIHVDALATFFMFSAILSYLYVLKTKETKFVLFTGVFTGFALLTKINSFVLFPFFISCEFFNILLYQKHVFFNFKLVSKRLITLTLIVIATFFVFFPAMWTAPVVTLKKIVLDGFLDTALNEESARIVYLGLSLNSFIYKYLSYMVQIFFRTTPHLLLLSIIGFYIFIKNFFKTRENDKFAKTLFF